jgi:ABC-type antimicrobial peptide transport system permease subunit
MPRVVVINAAMASAIWPGENPIGRCMRFERQDAPCYTIIGIAANASRDRIVQSPMPQYYLPLDNMPMPGWSRNPTLVVRATPDRIGAVIGALRSELHAAWPEGIAKVTRMSDALEPQYRPWRLGATLFSAFGLVALVIAAVGIFSTVSYSVSQRTHEFGVRIALGARLGDVLRVVIGDGLRTAALGVAIGIVLALAAGRAIESLLYGIKASDPGVILFVAVILLTVAVVAALAPAWKAARVDPITALRSE